MEILNFYKTWPAVGHELVVERYQDKLGVTSPHHTVAAAGIKRQIFTQTGRNIFQLDPPGDFE